MIKVGITGGIGSGKTTVCRIFEVLGVPVYYADIRAKEILETDKPVIKKVKELLGDSVYDAQNTLDRKRVAEIVFNFPEILEAYNAIIHPVVMEDAARWMKKHQHFSYVIKEAALLFEAGSYKELNYIICVTAPEAVRIARVMQRDHSTKEAVLARMQNQWPDEDRIERSDFIIYNDGATPLLPQVVDIHKKLMDRAS